MVDRARQEIVDTEYQYIADLETMLATFAPLLATLKPNEKATLFDSIQPILRVSKSLVRALADDASVKGVAAAFKKHAPYFKVYSSFVQQFSQAQTLLGELRRNRLEFSTLLAELEKKDTLRGLTLESFLIMPVQRVPRYKLLLEVLCKHVSKHAGENAELRAALAEVSSVASYINEKIRQHENRMKMLAVQTALGGSGNVVKPARTWVYEGDMTKMCRRGPKAFRFYLFNDVLVYASRLLPGRGAATSDPERRKRGSGLQDRALLPGMGRTHSFHRSLDLATMAVRSGAPLPNSKPPMEHVIEIKSPQKSFLVSTATLALKQTWLCELEGAIAAAVAAQPRQRNPGGTSAPIWKPDASSNVCSVCSGPFTLFNRKHHCRNWQVTFLLSCLCVCVVVCVLCVIFYEYGHQYCFRATASADT